MLPKLDKGWHWFDCEFRIADGSRWCFYIAAQSSEDAETRVRHIRENARVSGRVVEQIEAGDDVHVLHMPHTFPKYIGANDPQDMGEMPLETPDTTDLEEAVQLAERTLSSTNARAELAALLESREAPDLDTCHYAYEAAVERWERALIDAWEKDPSDDNDPRTANRMPGHMAGLAEVRAVCLGEVFRDPAPQRAEPGEREANPHLQAAWSMLAAAEFDFDHGYNDAEAFAGLIARWRVLSNENASPAPTAGSAETSDVRVEEIPGGLALKTTRSPVSWSQEPRCEVCDWPLAPLTGSGCRPGDCRYRPTQGSDEWYRINARRDELAAKLARPAPSASGETKGEVKS